MTYLNDTAQSSVQAPIFQLKGSLFTFTVLQLLSFEPAVFQEQLSARVRQAPKFFQQAPIVIDLQKLNDPENHLDLSWLVDQLRAHGLLPIGLRSSQIVHQEASLSLGLAVLPETKQELPTTNTKKEPQPAKAAVVPIQAAKLITQQVRAGQQIYAQGGDLIVVATVNPGAELLADGNIHIYGALRGRALAGINGNASARIFCQQLDAELISIAGHYWLKEDIASTYSQQAITIYLEEERLQLAKL